MHATHQLQEAKRVIKRLLPFLCHDHGCAWLNGDRPCSCDYGKLYKRARRLGCVPKKDEQAAFISEVLGEPAPSEDGREEKR